ncbi:sporulation inhibitor of replication protein SirA [Alteribacter natronophilus]|uniref:sporulation inhibitor of replication protein SirA n=1 Tax=Alteribacter natronophilus TaxID=2583810 RepID=UPI0014869B7E|nr:sporulation inhibitor of replication protein SirA [Alteribacter natronophilus]
MRSYDLFLINEEVALVYYGFESKLFHLFREHRYANSELKEITGRQVRYIRKPIDEAEISTWLQRACTDMAGYEKNGQAVHCFTSEDRKSRAVLTLGKHAMTLESEGSFELETAIFDTLREYDDFFFAADYDNARYGWLKPLKSFRIVEPG